MTAIKEDEIPVYGIIILLTEDILMKAALRLSVTIWSMVLRNRSEYVSCLKCKYILDWRCIE